MLGQKRDVAPWVSVGRAITPRLESSIDDAKRKIAALDVQAARLYQRVVSEMDVINIHVKVDTLAMEKAKERLDYIDLLLNQFDGVAD